MPFLPRDETSARLLELRGLRTYFPTDDGFAQAVDGVNLTVERGETVALVGESGCGKSVTALSILGLVPPPGQVRTGEVLFKGRDLRKLEAEELRRLRGNEIAMVFQEPMTSLNPVYTVGEQIAETVRLHRGLDRRAARAVALEMLELVGIPSPQERLDAYPHQLSGGMRQRVVIAIAMSCDPALLIADEPTTALDVTVQAQILKLFARLQERSGMGLLLITHNLGIVAETADRVCVMYAGRIVEEAAVEQLLRKPRHPYTIGLMRSLPERARHGEPLETIAGTVPDPARFPSGCRFRPRCPLARAACEESEPELSAAGAPDDSHVAACHFLDEAEGL
jgi:oligopeptide/dipeptide ABC transporter ATP-binding protein